MAVRQVPASDVDVDLGRLFSSIGRDWKRILLVALIVTAAAFALVSIMTPSYRGETRLLIETRESEFTRRDPGSNRDAPILDEEGVTSQVEVIASSDLLRKVAADLKLSEHAEFDGGPSLIDRLLVMAGLGRSPDAIPQEERVLRAFRERLLVYRVENSRVIVVQFSSEDPELAASVPNALADAYLAFQQQARLESDSEATGWLEPEIADLREKVREAEARVAAYRGQTGLLMGQNNSVLATQQLSELSSELSRVRASRASAEANAESVRAALNNGASLDALPEVLASGLIQRLREREVELRAQIADLSTTLLDNHPRIRALRSQLGDLDRQIRAEARKVLVGLENEARSAQAREQKLMADLNSLKAASAQADEDNVELRALEREAAAQRELLESYLTRYREATSRRDGNYLPANARIFSRATVPSVPYFPKKLPIVASAFVASLLVMVIITLLRELFSGRAMVPAPGARMERVDEVQMPEPAVAVAPPPPMSPVIAPVAPAPVPSAQETPAEPSNAEPERKPRFTERLRRRLPFVPPKIEIPLEQPAQPVQSEQASGFEEPRHTIGEIAVPVAAERLVASGATRAVVVSPEGDEGAATSVMVAREIADFGLRVVLIDLTAAGAASRPMLESSAFKGVTNLLTSEAQFADVIHPDVYSESHIIPIGTADIMRAMRSVARLPIILQSLGTAYDIIIVECGPVDSAAIRRLVDETTEILVSAIDISSGIEEVVEQFVADGMRRPMIVTPNGGLEPSWPGRSAA